MTPSDHVLYSITHDATGRQYLGVTSLDVRRRWQAHARASTRLGRCLRKYGAHAFTFKVEATLPTRAELNIAERIAIAVRRPAFNLTAGGEGALGLKRTHSAEHRAKIAAALTGRVRPQHERDKISASTRGRKLTPAHIAAFVKAKRGLKHTDAARENYSTAARKRAATAEGKANIARASALGAAAKRGTVCVHTEQTRAKMAASARKRASTTEGRDRLLKASARGAAARRKAK